MLVLLVGTVTWLARFAWRKGKLDAQAISASRPDSDLDSASNSMSFQVNGSSMAPTLLGECEIAECDSCDLRYHVDLTGVNKVDEGVLCSHCGDSMSIVDPDPITRHMVIAADVVQMEPLAEATELARGDLVAVQWQGQLRVKRIVALPGDIVQLDGSRLTMDGKRLEDLLIDGRFPFDLPRFLVDDDSRRPMSRWSPEAEGSGWQRNADRKWQWIQPGTSPWLIYHHKSVYDHDQPSPVWDDYPFNAGIDRKLYGVDRLEVESAVHCRATTQVRVAYWSARGNVLATSLVGDGQSLAVSYHQGKIREGLPVTPQHPIAIQVAAGPCTLEDLRIRRLIEYRLRPGDDRDRYPLQVDHDHCYVLGDNVPISVDSRDIGLVPIARIKGLVTKRQHRPAGADDR